jgi:hypothetical protein
MRLRRFSKWLVLGCAAVAWADFAASAWQYRKLMQHVDARAANSMRIDKDIYLLAREDLADLRVEHGADEVPYLIVTAAPQVTEKEVTATMQDRVVTPAGVEAVMSFAHVVPHNRLTIQTNITNFRHKVQLYASEDGHDWALVKKDAYVFDFTADEHHASLLTIDYPTSTRRLLKVVIEGAKDPAILAGASMMLREERPAGWQEIAKIDDPTPVEDDKRHATMYVLDLGSAGLPRDRMLLTVTDPAFHRTVSVETSTNSKDWSGDSFGTIYRVEGAEELRVGVGATRDRYVRVTLFHGDDKPLHLKSVLIETLARSVVFPSQTAGDYYLYFGNPAAHAPSYDLAMVLPKRALEGAVAVTPEGRERNPNYKAPEPPVKPMSERYPGLLYGVLGVAVVGLGYLTLRFMQTVKDSGEGGA